jgi:hypothetical protein
MQLIHKLIDPLDRVPILDRLLFQGPIVNAHPHCVVLLLHQHYKRSEWTRTRFDVSHLQQFLNRIFDFILKFIWMSLAGSDHMFCPLLQLNGVLKYPVKQSPWRYLFKNHVMPTQQHLNICMMMLLVLCFFLSCNQALRCTCYIFVFEECFHTFG